MKNLLSENMLRFGTKNLSESNIENLVSEQKKIRLYDYAAGLRNKKGMALVGEAKCGLQSRNNKVQGSTKTVDIYFIEAPSIDFTYVKSELDLVPVKRTFYFPAGFMLPDEETGRGVVSKFRFCELFQNKAAALTPGATGLRFGMDGAVRDAINLVRNAMKTPLSNTPVKQGLYTYADLWRNSIDNKLWGDSFIFAGVG